MKNRTFYLRVVRAARRRRQQLRQHRQHDDRAAPDHRRGTRNAAADHQQRRVPCRRRQSAVRGRHRFVPGQGRSSDAVGSEPHPPVQLRRQPEREHRAVRRPGRDAAAAAFLDSSDNMLAASHTGVFRRKWVNELRFQYRASAIQDVISLDPRCNGECDLENEGGPTLEIIGVASVGRQRFTPTAENERSLPVPRHDQLLQGLAPVQGRHRLQHRQALASGAAAALRRPLHFRELLAGAGSGHSRRADSHLVDPGGRARPSGALRPGVRATRHRLRLSRPLALRAGRLAAHATS